MQKYTFEILFCTNMLIWLFSTYKCAGAILGFIHILSDATRLKIFEFTDPVAYETLRKMGEQNKISYLMPKIAFRFMVCSLIWVLSLGFMFVLLMYGK